MALVPVHGGLSQPVNRTIPFSKRKALHSEAFEMPRIAVSDADLSTVYRFADGTLSPLTGPMNADEFNHVLANRCIVREGKSYAWTIPLSLPVTDTEAASLKVGQRAALVNSQGEVVGALKVESIFDWDKSLYIEKVYRTQRTDHPGGEIVMNDARTKLVGGEIEVLPMPSHPEFGQWVMTPRQVRQLIEERGYEAALAFQTRNPLHRAHEYALVFGAEVLTRAGHYTGVFLNPLVGQLKGDDVDAATRMRTYASLKATRGLGQGDSDTALWQKVGYDINDVFHLVGLDIKMYYGGPSEAIMHAIYRQNLGFSHLVIGRKHADAPYRDGSAIWGDFDAQEIFDDLPGELHVKPVKVGFAAYYESLGRVDLTENHPGEKPFSISGTKIRSMLEAGEFPPSEIMRPSTAQVLMEAYRAKRG
ncbi:MAG: sulfate adenylyltransferase [Myxococcota bacterium]